MMKLAPLSDCIMLAVNARASTSVPLPGAKGTMAPNLLGVVGRKAGSTDFAMYSPQLKAYGKVWTPGLIDQWLASPAKLVPGARMGINVSDAKDRADAVAYLATLKK